MSRLSRLAVAVTVGLLLVAAAGDEAIAVKFLNKGFTLQGKEQTKVPYQTESIVQMAQADILKLIGENKVEAGSSWDADGETVNKLFKNFDAGAESVTGTLKLAVKEVKETGASIDLTGSIAVKRTDSGGKAKKTIDAALAGSLAYDTVAKKVTGVNLEGKDLKIGGTWDPGDGNFLPLTGEGTLSLKSGGEEKPPETAAKPEENKPKFGPGATPPGGGFGPGGGGGMPNIDKELLIGQAMTRLQLRALKKILTLTEEQEGKIADIVREYGSSFGSVPQMGNPGEAPKLRHPNEMHKEAVEKIKPLLTDEQKPKFEEYLSKLPGAGKGATNSNTNKKSGQEPPKEEPKKEEPPKEDPAKEEPKVPTDEKKEAPKEGEAPK
ncbi:MAG: hypothetical protein A2Z34_00280 [Planctomycetes bacterium RBG_16_59_8]|nr:MAG: hypothetical protein A2Z34_00280 [Planctomycetes bacterium RBG_16_59_8]